MGRCPLHIVVGVIGGVVALVGGLLLALKPTLVHQLAAQQLPTTKAGGPTWPLFQAPSPNEVRILWAFRMFNVTNPGDVKVGTPPILETLGPYTYVQTKYKTGLAWNDDRTSISFGYHETYSFSQAESGTRHPSDVITILNAPLMIAGYLLDVYDIPADISGYILDRIHNETVFMQRSVDALLFGYPEPLLVFLQQVLKPLGITIPIDMSFQGNDTKDTYDAPTVLHTGKGDLSSLGQYRMWAGYGSMPYWRTGWANMLNGTDGSHAKPFLTKEDQFHVFVNKPLYRSLLLSYERNTNVKDIDVYRFTLHSTTLQNATEYPPNGDFYMFGPSGVWNMTAHYHGPVFMSLPHFLHADPWYRTLVNMTPPDPTLHSTWVDCEPILGFTVRIHERLQINVVLREYKDVKVTMGMPLAYVPLFWVDEYFTLSDKWATWVKHHVFRPLLFLTVFAWVGLVLGCLAVGVSLWLWQRRRDGWVPYDVVPPDDPGDGTGDDVVDSARTTNS